MIVGVQGYSWVSGVQVLLRFPPACHYRSYWPWETGTSVPMITLQGCSVIQPKSLPTQMYKSGAKSNAAPACAPPHRTCAPAPKLAPNPSPMATQRRPLPRGAALPGRPAAKASGGNAGAAEPAQSQVLLSVPRSARTSLGAAGAKVAVAEPAPDENEGRQRPGARVHGGDTSAHPPTRKRVAIAAHQANSEHAAPAPSATLLAISAPCTLEERFEHMVASAHGGPRASGRPAVAHTVTYGLLGSIIAAVEAVMAQHGYDELRANCGGLLARDESYGFLLTDLLMGQVGARTLTLTLTLTLTQT